MLGGVITPLFGTEEEPLMEFMGLGANEFLKSLGGLPLVMGVEVWNLESTLLLGLTDDTGLLGGLKFLFDLTPFSSGDKGFLKGFYQNLLSVLFALEHSGLVFSVQSSLNHYCCEC